MKKFSAAVWGIVIIAVGVIYGLNVLEITQINLLFDGWWTLFIIIPCFTGLISGRDKSACLIGLVVGVLLLLNSQEILDMDLVLKLLVPALIIAVGLKVLLKAVRGNKAAKVFHHMEEAGIAHRVVSATFSGTNVSFDGQVFEGVELVAAFGGVKCDLRNAIIQQDCAIKVSAVFGGIDVWLPDGVNVETNVTCFFGGVDNKSVRKVDDAPTIYVSGTCLFGGVDFK